jgi:hypothetical protein
MIPFARAACSLMAASLSSPQPTSPSKQKLNRTKLNPLVNSLMMSMILLEIGHEEIEIDEAAYKNERTRRALRDTRLLCLVF